MFELYGPYETDFLNFVRSIAVAEDGERWVFEQAGTPLPFEDTARYTARRIRDRFTFDMLERYLKELGLSPFEESFYLPPDKPSAELVEKIGPRVANSQDYTLDEARAAF